MLVSIDLAVAAEDTRAAMFAEEITISRKAPSGTSLKPIERAARQTVDDGSKLRPIGNSRLSMREGRTVAAHWLTRHHGVAKTLYFFGATKFQKQAGYESRCLPS